VGVEVGADPLASAGSGQLHRRCPADVVPPPGWRRLHVAYGRITIEYRPQLPDGSLGQPVVTGWDARANRRL
jgi:hypothetical protein